jgi:hypothetical protein
MRNRRDSKRLLDEGGITAKPFALPHNPCGKEHPPRRIRSCGQIWRKSGFRLSESI